MILTLTPNPALDITYTVPGFRPHAEHRVTDVAQQAGGKGVNAARVLHALGRPVLALVPLGGATGAAVEDDLRHSGIPYARVPISGETRRTIAVADTTDTTLLNEPGPTLHPAEWAALRTRLTDLLPGAQALILAGSLPPGTPDDAYADLIRLAHAHAVPVVLDTSGPALTAALPSRPTAVKPNAAELRAATGLSDPAQAAARLRTAGAQSVVASLGPDGLLATTPTGTWRAHPPLTLSGNPAGAGDSVVAALAAGLADATPWPDLLANAAALSAATVLTPHAGTFDPTAYHHFTTP
ncbi:1-phosphofructokinase [Peterkaempfera bronchialis]|uniref:1-phosphofructokinase family hexose kinase n=1 Tax=Peterkaempfera bronchialis TaxID=2126346 RepID=UPI000DAD2B08